MRKTILSRSLFLASFFAISLSINAKNSSPPPMAVIDQCDISTGDHIYKQQDFIFVERDNDHFTGTMVDGKKIQFYLSSMRNTNDISDVIHRFFWIRNACLKEAVKHVQKEDGVSVELPATIMLESIRLEKPFDN